jgi:hypothetical protein
MNILRLLFIIILFVLIYQILKGLVGGRASRKAFSDQNEAASKDGEELVQDPQCGVYIPRSQGVASLVDGRVLYFHSHECRDKYLLARQGKSKGGTR